MKTPSEKLRTCEMCGYRGTKSEVYTACDLMLCKACYNDMQNEIKQQERPENQL